MVGMLGSPRFHVYRNTVTLYRNVISCILHPRRRRKPSAAIDSAARRLQNDAAPAIE
jgi:hypothetical protein